MNDAPVSYAYSTQKPTAQVLVTKIAEKFMPQCAEICAYIESMRASGNYLEHMSYGPDGQGVVNRDVRESLRIVPDFRADLQYSVEQMVKKYWAENFLPRPDLLLVCTQSEFFYYPPGNGIALHTDDHVMTTTGTVVGEDLHRGITTVTYLNDAYEGGEIEFPQQNLVLKPEPGTVVVFPSNRNFPHRVRPITSGSRMSFQRVYGLATTGGGFRAIPNVVQASCC